MHLRKTATADHCSSRTHLMISFPTSSSAAKFVDHSSASPHLQNNFVLSALFTTLVAFCPSHCTMFEIRKSFTFEASHQLTHHDGKCARLHGHSYSLTIELTGPTLKESGPQKNMLADFSLIALPVKKVIASHLDHHHLNDSLQTDSPTAEFIARWLYHHLLPALPLLTAVTVCETATCSATFRPQLGPAPCQCSCVTPTFADTHSQQRSEEEDPKSDDPGDP